MKKLSLKWKLTLLYTLFATLLTFIILTVLLYLGSGSILASTQNQLKERVYEGFDLFDMKNGILRVDSDFSDVEGGVYLSAYDASGSLLSGRIPYGFSSSIAVLEDTVQTAKLGGSTWYIFDASSSLRDYGTIRIRGICSVSALEEELRLLIRLALILLPLSILLSAVLCFSLVRRTLRPVYKITQTAREICEKKDLSRRISLKGGRDEITTLAETFDTMLAQLEDAFERQKQFTSDVSHELRTPLAVILSQCDDLLGDPHLSPEERASVKTIQDRTRTLTRLVSQLLFLSRTDQNRQVLTLEPLDLSLITKSVAEEQELFASEKNITLEAEIQENIFIQGDETLLIRLWMNLIENAVSYTQEGGCVQVGLSKEGETVTGYVKDNGMGISKEDLPKIWQRFYRADSSRTDSSHSGLGLSMVQWIVQAHGGTIHAESTKGEGSLFLFTLPAE